MRVFCKSSIMDDDPVVLDENAVIVFQFGEDQNDVIEVRFGSESGRLEVRSRGPRYLDIQPDASNVITVGRLE